MAYIYFGLTIFCGIWAYTTYIKRLHIIEERSGQHLDAPLGPIVLATVLAFTLIVNFLVAFREQAVRQQLIQSESFDIIQGILPEKLVNIQNFIFNLVGAS